MSDVNATASDSLKPIVPSIPNSEETKGGIFSRIWSALTKVSENKAAMVIIGLAVSVSSFFVGRWFESPRLAIETTVIRLKSPDELTVNVSFDSDLESLKNELPIYYALQKPEMLRVMQLLSPPISPTIIMQNGAAPTVRPSTIPQDSPASPTMVHNGANAPNFKPFGLPAQLTKLNISELRELYKLSDLPIEILEEAKKNPPPNLPKGDEINDLDKKTMKEAWDRIMNRPNNLKLAKARIDALDSEWKAKYGVFHVEVVVTNSGGRTISLGRPIQLLWIEGSDTAEIDLSVVGDASVVIPPNESRKIVLVSNRADDASKDVNRRKAQDRWGNGKCKIRFTDSNSEHRDSREVVFATR